MKKCLSVVILLVGILCVVCIVVAAICWNVDSHILNTQYRLWKIGLLQIDDNSDIRYRFLMGDLDFREGMVGKTFEEVKVLYPDIKTFGKGNVHQQYYETDKHNAGYYWLGESNWGVLVKDGYVRYITIFKG